MAKQNNGKKRVDPLSNPRTMGREGLRIIKDIAFGRYNIYEEGHIFRNQDFVKAIIAELDKRITDLNIHIYAINVAFSNGRMDQSVYNLWDRDNRTRAAYILTKEVMSNILMSGDTGFLLVLANKLSMYKYNI